MKGREASWERVVRKGGNSSAIPTRISVSSVSDCVVELSKGSGDEALQQLQDSELTRRSQAGDTEAFGTIVTKYRTKIFSMIYGIVGNECDAWDLAQEGFLKAWRSIHRFQGRSSFYTWLYRITINGMSDSLRRRCRRSEVELDDAIPLISSRSRRQL